MARSVFYYHLKRLKAKDKYASEREMIKSIFHAHKGRYGYRRVTAEMRNNYVVLNHKTVQRLMVQMGLRSQIRKVRYRSYKGAVGRIAPNIINRDFAASAPNRKWATDVTQINIGSEKLYLSPILDMFNGEIISYNISRSPNLEQIYDMLDKAKLLLVLIVLTVLSCIPIKVGNISIVVTVDDLKNMALYKACPAKETVLTMQWPKTSSAL